MTFWFSMLAGITPPVCISAYVAAQVAQADPMKTGFNSLKMGAMFYLIPILFLFTNILTGSIYQILSIFTVVMFAVYFMVVGVEGYFLTRINVFERLLSILVFLLMFITPFNMVSISIKIMFVLTAVIISTTMYFRQRKVLKIS